MKTGLILMGMACFNFSVLAEEVKGIDYCHDANVSQVWQKLLADYPHDPIIIKLAGLREGLCMMIERKQITHDQGTDIWEDNRQRSIEDREQDQSKKMPKFSL